LLLLHSVGLCGVFPICGIQHKKSNKYEFPHCRRCGAPRLPISERRIDSAKHAQPVTPETLAPGQVLNGTKVESIRPRPSKCRERCQGETIGKIQANGIGCGGRHRRSAVRTLSRAKRN
jgi:hypothetical protein